MALNAEQASAMTGPASVDGVGQTQDPHAFCEQADRKRRQQSDWASKRL